MKRKSNKKNKQNKQNKKSNKKSNRKSKSYSCSYKKIFKFGGLATFLGSNTPKNNKEFNFVLKDNVLRRLLSELDNKYREMLIEYCNPRILRKYSIYKNAYSNSEWGKMVLKDPFLINPNVWLNKPVINQNNKLFKNNNSKIMDILTVKEIMKQWLSTDCERVYFLNVDNYKHMQDIILDSYNSTSDRNRTKLVEEKRLYNLLERGIIIMCINEATNPLDAHYVCFFKNPEGSDKFKYGSDNYVGISTNEMGLNLML